MKRSRTGTAMEYPFSKFPSSTEDGSIEAFGGLAFDGLAIYSFRPQLRTAPLKLHDQDMVSACGGRFPSSTEDGSIEAARPHRHSIRCPASFRPQLRTAPLKHSVVPHCGCSSGCFRPQLRTAPLKRVARQAGHSVCNRFPSSTEDGSIEAAAQTTRTGPPKSFPS